MTHRTELHQINLRRRQGDPHQRRRTDTRIDTERLPETPNSPPATTVRPVRNTALFNSAELYIASAQSRGAFILIRATMFA